MSQEPHYKIQTILGPIAVMPECKAQAVCVNGSHCWEAGRCLRDPAVAPSPSSTESDGGTG